MAFSTFELPLTHEVLLHLAGLEDLTLQEVIRTALSSVVNRFSGGPKSPWVSSSTAGESTPTPASFRSLLSVARRARVATPAQDDIFKVQVLPLFPT